MDTKLQWLLDNFEQSVRITRTGYLVAEEPPQAKQSTRFGRYKPKGTTKTKVRAFTDAKKEQYVAKLCREFTTNYQGVKLCGSVRITVLYCFPWNKSQAAMRSLGWALADKNIDLDNMLKPVQDALQGIVMMNDSQICEVRARKIRYDRGLIALKIDEIRPNREIFPP